MNKNFLNWKFHDLLNNSGILSKQDIYVENRKFIQIWRDLGNLLCLLLAHLIDWHLLTPIDR